ncbi:hypothetical protein RB653_010563 [Dictyostelium firmibasis]|uniref:Peroxidase n=1 Tax=Dictyostelium firmibasis TaxID=79012 RepID=A0AAN7TT92_9MYCE
MAQTTILPMHCLYGIFLEGNLKINKNDQDGMKIFKENIKKFTNELDELDKKSPQSRIGGAICFSSDIWGTITNKISKPKELKSVNTLSSYMPGTSQRDILIHIISDRMDTCFKLAQDTLGNFGDQLDIKQEIHGFRRWEERDLTDFIDGTENPEGDKLRTKYGLVAAGQPHEFGSYVFTQRYVHNLKKWNPVPISIQQDTIGRTKVDSIEIPKDKRPITSHVSRTDLNENGEDLKIVRQSLPYGQITGEKGLMFISYSCSLHNIEKQLQSMFGQLDGKHDLILQYTTPVSGGFYFAPSKKELSEL